MKVTHVITPINYGGGENLILNLIQSMGNRVDNSVLSLAYSKEFEKHLDANKIKHNRVSNKDLGASPKKMEYLYFLIANIFRSFFMRGKIEGEIVHAHGFPANIFIAFMKKMGLLKGKKIVFTSHSEKKGEKAFVRQIYLFFLKEYHWITCVGQRSYDSMLIEFPELKDKIVKINNGIKIENFYYKEPNNVLKNSLEYKEEDIIAIYISRLSHVKNHKFLIELMNKIDNPKFKLILIGEGEEKASLEQMIKKCSLENRVKLLGYIKNEELIDYYSIADMILFPSSSEGFGISIVEGLACKKPLVLFENIYFDELKDSVLVAKTEEEFVKHTQNLIKDESLRKSLGTKAELVRQELAIENCAKAYEKLYGSL